MNRHRSTLPPPKPGNSTQSQHSLHDPDQHRKLQSGPWMGHACVDSESLRLAFMSTYFIWIRLPHNINILCVFGAPGLLVTVRGWKECAFRPYAQYRTARFSLPLLVSAKRLSCYAVKSIVNPYRSYIPI